MPEKTRIVLIDDHGLVREGIGRMLDSQPDLQVVASVGTVDEGVTAVASQPVDLVLLDINLPFKQGGSFIDLARAAGFWGQILVLTAGINPIEAVRLKKKGCAGIFPKTEKPERLLDEIRRIMSGDKTASVIIESAVKEEERNPPLTPRELEVLRKLYGGASNKEIANDLQISESLVKAFVQQLFRKTGVRSRAQLVRAAVDKYANEMADDPAALDATE